MSSDSTSDIDTVAAHVSPSAVATPAPASPNTTAVSPNAAAVPAA